MKGSTSSGNVNLNKCVRCGDCATGCNFGAKNSLDVNLLASAQQGGAEIFSGATVLSIEKDGGSGWIVNCVHTNATLRAARRQRVEDSRAQGRAGRGHAGLERDPDALARPRAAAIRLHNWASDAQPMATC